MKKSLTNNIGIKILSLGIALILWIVIINIDDPARTKTFQNVAVELLNPESIEKTNKVFDVIEGGLVDVTVKANKSVIDKLRVSDLSVTADLININNNGAVQIEPSCPKYPSIDVELGKVKYLKVSLENKKTKQFKVEVVKKGTEAEGYNIPEFKLKPSIIEVSGAESQIDLIAKVVIEVNVDNLSENYKERLEPKAYDKNDNLISSDKLAFSTSLVQVNATVLPTKVVPISLELKGDPAYGYEVIGKEYEPKEIEIVAKQEVLDAISSIPIEIDMEGRTESKEFQINMLDYLDGANLVNESDKTLIVNVKIEKLEIKDITFTSNEINVENLPNDMKFNYNKANEVYSVKIMGLKETLSKITGKSLSPYINLNNVAIGVHEVTINFDKSLKIEYLNKPRVSIELTDLNVVDAATPVPTQSPIVSTPSVTPSIEPTP